LPKETKQRKCTTNANLKLFLAHKQLCITQKTFGSHRSWTPAPDLGNQRSLKTEREPDKTRSRRVLCVADRFVLTFWFFFVKEKERKESFK
jgi:hypothetical protein